MAGSRKNRSRTRAAQGSARGSRKTSTSGIRSATATGCLFWACLFIILATVIYIAREPLTSTFKKLLVKEEAPPSVVVTPLTPENKEQPREDKEEVKIDEEPVKASPAEQARKDSVASKPAAAPPPEKPVVRKARLFFVTVDPAGKIVMKGTIRPVPVSDTPLRDVLTALLSGPTSQEMNLGFLTMIPSEAKLKSVNVRADTAVLDFTESFRFNTLGMEGLTAQLKQVVYAATEFPTVKKVQILIEGRKVQYLGTEGVRIDRPLSRESFAE